MREQFQKILTDFIEREITGMVPRDYPIPLESPKIISLIGVRRSGKSSILFDRIIELRKHYPKENILYINFEDDRLFPLKLKHLDDLLEGYFELYPAKRDEKIFLFIDEVQVVDGWERYVRRIYDTLNVQIFITGSSANLLHKEIATALRGRTLSFEIFPFSFAEYLRFKGVQVNLHSFRSLSHIRNHLDRYLINGGFAETINEQSLIARKILSDYLELIVYKDIADRHHITNTALLKHLNKYCFTNIATLLSFTRLFNEFKSQGFKLSKDTIFNYMAYLEDAYALFTVPVYRNSIKAEQRNPKKIYAVDNGFKKIYDYAIGEDKSKLYENAVFLHLRRRSSEIYYYKGVQEVDFYVRIDGEEQLINVCYQLDNPKTREQEIDGLLEAMDYFALTKGVIVTAEKKETLQLGHKTVHILPLHEWLLVGTEKKQ
jgi:predicted AAA+ superfamily ATPase